MTTYTPNLNLALPSDGDGSGNGQPWGAGYRAALSAIDTALTDINCRSFQLTRVSGTDAAVVSGALTGANLFAHAYEDTTSFSSSTTGAYCSYDSLVTMTGTLAYNHFASYEARKTYAGSGILNEMMGFFSAETISGPVNAYRHVRVQDAGGAGTITEQSGLWVPNLTRGTSNYAAYLNVSAGTNNYNVYAVGTAQNLMNGRLKANGGLTLPGDGTLNTSVDITNSSGQFFHFTTNTNLVLTGTGTMVTLSSLNDGGNTYEPLLFNASVVVLNCIIRMKVLTVGTLGSATAGGKALVSDSSVVAAGNFGAIVVGGGTNTVPVYADGTNWRIG